MDIQRGDQVYYRGEVWTVEKVKNTARTFADVLLTIREDALRERVIWTFSDCVEKVEQVR